MTTDAAELPVVEQRAEPWTLYLLECRNGHFYAGITNDLAKRFQAHLRGRGAKYTRANPPLRILASRDFASKPQALRAEHAIKKLPRARKLPFMMGEVTC